MNIFYLDTDPREAARMQCDKHVVKMILESAQMLSTAHRVLDGVETKRMTKNCESVYDWLVPDLRRRYRNVYARQRKWYAHPDFDDELYACTHMNHPCNVWIREGGKNYYWLLQHFYALGNEYTYRYGKEHSTINKLQDILWAPPENIPPGSTPVRLAMPDELKTDDPVESYRAYYRTKLDTIKMRWTERKAPEWMKLENA